MELTYCDFCHSTDVKWDYPVDTFTQLIEKPNLSIDWTSIGDWAACDECHRLIQEDRREQLAAKALSSFEHEYGTSADRNTLYGKIRILHDEFLAMRSGFPKEIL